MSRVDDHKQPFNPLLAVLAALAALFFVFPLIGLITGADRGVRLVACAERAAPR